MALLPILYIVLWIILSSSCIIILAPLLINKLHKILGTCSFLYLHVILPFNNSHNSVKFVLLLSPAYVKKENWCFKKRNNLPRSHSDLETGTECKTTCLFWPPDCHLHTWSLVNLLLKSSPSPLSYVRSPPAVSYYYTVNNVPTIIWAIWTSNHCNQ